MYLDIARASMTRLLRSGPLVGQLPAMAPEEAGGRELAQLVANHVLGDVDRDELVAVVHRHSVADKLRRDGRGTRPRLDDALVAALVHLPDLAEQLCVDVRTLLDRSRHGLPTSSPCRAYVRERCTCWIPSSSGAS